MFGTLLVGAFATVVLAYVFTEYVLTRFDVRRRVLVGDGLPLLPILYANGVSFLVTCTAALHSKNGTRWRSQPGRPGL